MGWSSVISGEHEAVPNRNLSRRLGLTIEKKEIEKMTLWIIHESKLINDFSKVEIK